MKKLMITTLIMFSPLLFFAQVGVGGGFEYSFHLGVQAKADLPVSKVFSIDPYVTYVTHVRTYSNVETRYHSISIGAEGHYNFYVKEKFIVYPLAGINYHINFWYDKLKFTVGVGTTYALTEKLKAYVETKYLHRNEALGIDAGLLFIINNN